jgi:SynChlorMet cassette protein ScmD
MDTRKPIANPVVAIRKEFDDWAVLFNPDNGEAVGVNPVGVAIWEMLTGDNTITDIAGHIEEVFTDVPGAAGQEIKTFIDDLTTGGFVGLEVSSPDR